MMTSTSEAEQLQKLTFEIRDKMVEYVTKHGGRISLKDFDYEYFNGKLGPTTLETVAKNIGLEPEEGRPAYSWYNPRHPEIRREYERLSPMAGSATIERVAEDAYRRMSDMLRPVQLPPMPPVRFVPFDDTPPKKSKKKVVKKVAPPEPKVTLDSVIISDEKKEEIRSAMAQIKNSKKIFDDWGFSKVFEKGTAITLLFYGIPGTGKTLMAQAIAEEIGAELKIYGTAEIQSSEPGGAERMVKKIFNDARDLLKRNKKQRVILFDECDSLLYDRNKVGVILGAQINAMLTEIEKHDGIIIFTTNRMGKLDPALERRIAAKIEFPFPDKSQREAIWKRLIPEKAPIAKDVDLKELATYPLAGGNIKNAVLNAARMAAYQESKEITMQHFLNAVEKESISAQAFSAEFDAGPTGDLGDVHMSDENKIVVGEKNLNIKRTFKAK